MARLLAFISFTSVCLLSVVCDCNFEINYKGLECWQTNNDIGKE